MMKDEGWRLKDEGRMLKDEGLRLDICDCRVAFTTENDWIICIPENPSDLVERVRSQEV